MRLGAVKYILVVVLGTLNAQYNMPTVIFREFETEAACMQSEADYLVLYRSIAVAYCVQENRL